MISIIECFKTKVFEGALSKNLKISDVVLDRINYEISTIERLGFVEYFITFSKIVDICNELNLIRYFGSATALYSIVNYCLDITKINPITENLMFEVFMLPDQTYKPILGITIPKGCKEVVIDKFKQNCPDYYVYSLALTKSKIPIYDSIIHNGSAFFLKSNAFIITKDKQDKTFILENGQEYYIVEDELNDPLYTSKIFIFEVEYLNKLLLISNEVGDKYHPYKLPLNDKNVFNFFVNSDLKNVYLFDSPMFKKIVNTYRPTCVNDLALIHTIWHPYRMNLIPVLFKNKSKKHKAFCPSDPRVARILNETHNLLIYIETFLELSNEIAGINFVEARKWKRKIDQEKSDFESTHFAEVFKSGCRINSSLNENDLKLLTDLVLSMIKFTYPRAHALSLTIVTYWGCYYKLYFKEQFERIFSN